MAYKMKGFSGFKNSPVKQNKDPYTKKDYDFLKEQREERVHAMDYLTKTPTGPRAATYTEYTQPIPKKIKEKPSEVKLDPGYEDPVKIQRVQREGLTPHSQKFSKIAKENVKSKDYEKYSDLEKYDDDSPMKYNSPLHGCSPGDPGCGGNFKVNKKGTVISRAFKKMTNRVSAAIERKRSKIRANKRKKKQQDYYDSKGGSHKTVRYL
tara:strand:+ start:199 stop:822 length:624 start_codon:yes stop_codon:yes gene_type:complete